MYQVIAELPKGPLDKLVISVRQYQGHTFVDLRAHFLGDDEQWHPTKTGVTISPSQWDDFMTALGRVAPELSAYDHGRSPRKPTTVRR